VSAEKHTHQEAPPYEELLNAYYSAALRLVPLKPSLKKPLGNEWQRRPITREEVEDNLERGGGVGIQAGERSGWVSAADLDHPIARRLASYYLPDTLTSGKPKELPSHHVYISEGLGYRAILDTDGKHVIDVVASNDGAGHQFVVEPSVHEVKGPYKWTGGFDLSKIHRISSEDLDRRFGLLGAATLLAMYYPERGVRNDFGLCVAGYLLRNGESEEDVRQLLTNARLMQPEEPTKGSREGIFYAVQSTAKRMDRDQEFTGGKTLNGMVPKLAERLAQALGWERANTGEGRRSYMRTDDGNALRFIDRHGELLRYCPPWKTWLVWDGQRWLKGAEGAVLRLARETARSIFADAATAPDEETQKAIAKWAVSSQSANRIQAMIALASSDERVEVAPDVFDADPWLLNVENGTFDLRTGTLLEHDPTNHITKLAPAPYEPGAPAPRFAQFLSEVFAGEEDIIAFLQRFAGYTLTGNTRERLVTILYGFGKNGKSTLIETLHAALGDYAQNTDVETLLIKRYGGVGNDVAALKGARFVSAAEVEQGRRLAESKIKQLTGRDTITARFLFGEYFDFKPEFKLWLSTNNKPIIRGTDDAIWDRIALVPFTQRFVGEKADDNLPEKLRENELPGILAWMVEGGLAWQEGGLAKPKTVEDATQQYREEMDTLAAFFEDRCVIEEGASVGATDLYKKFKFWCETSGEVAGTQRAFGMRLSERGFVSKQGTSGGSKGRKIWHGIGLKVDDEDPDDDDFEPPDGENGPKVDDKSNPKGEKVDEGLPSENPSFAGDSSPFDEAGRRSRSKIHILPTTQPRVWHGFEKRSTSSTSSTRPPSDYRLIADAEGFETYLKELEEGA
jgi:putative DNA primase/helicase